MPWILGLVQKPAPDKPSRVTAARLSQTSQEAELQAAVDKATEAEARASEAEIRLKAAKVWGRAWG
jgi:hypothetical protein